MAVPSPCGLHRYRPSSSPLRIATSRMEGVYQQLSEEGVRVEQDFRNEKLGFKIREAQVQKIPYMLVIGDKEQETRTIAPRRRDGTDLQGMELEKFLTLIHKERKIPEAHLTPKEVKEDREQTSPC